MNNYNKVLEIMRKKVSAKSAEQPLKLTNVDRMSILESFIDSTNRTGINTNNNPEIEYQGFNNNN